MDFKAFIKRYFDSKEAEEINRNVSKKKYDEIFGSLTGVQSSIINDKNSRFIVVPAGPGSGKTYVLVRKLASLILMEDIKSEQQNIPFILLRPARKNRHCRGFGPCSK